MKAFDRGRQQPARTRWTLVVVAIGAGLVVAFQLGKAAIAMPLVRQELGIGLILASWILSAFATLGATAGLAAGLSVSRFGPRRAAILGLLLVGAASLAGALATGGIALLVTRIVEGCGFIAIAISVPSILREISADADRDVTLALWSTYLPAGTAIMMLIAPAILAYGWQALWIVNGIVALAYAGVVWALIPPTRSVAGPKPRLRDDIRNVVRAPGALALAVAFGVYAMQYFAIANLLPIILVDRLGVSLAAAGWISALGVMANAVGNLVAGALFRFRTPIWAIMIAAFVSLAVTAIGIFAQTSAWGVGIAACVSLGLTGMIPASIMAAAPRVAVNPALQPPTLGLIMQMSNLGQLTGPVVLAFIAQLWGWGASPILFVIIAAIGAAMALRLRRLET